MKASKIKDTTVSPTDSFFFDTNIWMFLFAPMAAAKAYKQKQYSALLKDILSREAMIWINSLVVAEYVNAVLRHEFKRWKRKENLENADFKHDFRPTKEYLSALSDVKLQVAEIMKITTRRPDDFHIVDIEKLISSMGSSYDYGDSVIIDACKRGGIKLVTDDTDITETDLPITVITA